MAEKTSTETNTETETEETSTETETEEELGEAGKKALDEERKARRDADKRAKKAEAELEKLRSEHASDADKAIAAAKAEGRTEALREANGRLLHAEITALAAGRLSDPADALRLLDLDDFTVGDDGAVDKKAITSAIDELVKEKPYLAAKGDGRPRGDGGGGPRGEPAGGKTSMNDLIRQKAGRA